MPTADPTPAARKPLDRKPLDHMDRLSDMLHFPALVNAGATLNILFTLAVTFALVGYLATNPPPLPATAVPVLWTALVLVLNVAPVVLLRLLGWQRTAPMPTLAGMHFTRDQHRFSSWVYLAASANMAFWILAAWPLFTARHTPSTLALVLVVAFLATFSPVLLRPLLRSAR